MQIIDPSKEAVMFIMRKVNILISHKKLESWIMNVELPWKCPKNLTVLQVTDSETLKNVKCKSLPLKMYRGDTLEPIHVPVKTITYGGND